MLQSPGVPDVIVREAQEVGSRELRRHQPNEILIQRAATVELPNGLVRMPVLPDGWVTVHARNLGGPTFLEECGGCLGAGAALSTHRGAVLAEAMPLGPGRH